MDKKIIKEIKKYDTIFVARHTGADPDALSSQYALRDILKNSFPKKEVYAVGSVSSKFRWLGRTNKINEDKIEEIAKKSLLIVLDTPDIKRIDTIDYHKFASVIKIDHHPEVDDYANLKLVDENACSTSQMIIEFVFNNKLYLDKSIGEKLYIGVISDSNRFLYRYTSLKTFELIVRLIKETNIDFTSLYENLYLRPLNEIRFQGYIYSNINVTENGLGYLKLDDKILNEYKVDSSTAGNMINDLSFIDDILVWVFCSEDTKNNIVKVSIRSRGPIINEVASKYNGGGHLYACGVRVKTLEEVDELIEDLDDLCAEYEEK